MIEEKYIMPSFASDFDVEPPTKVPEIDIKTSCPLDYICDNIRRKESVKRLVADALSREWIMKEILGIEDGWKVQ